MLAHHPTNPVGESNPCCPSPEVYPVGFGRRVVFRISSPRSEPTTGLRDFHPACFSRLGFSRSVVRRAVRDCWRKRDGDKTPVRSLRVAKWREQIVAWGLTLPKTGRYG